MAHVEQAVVQVLAVGREGRLARAEPAHDGQAEVEQRDHEHGERQDDRDERREQLAEPERRRVDLARDGDRRGGHEQSDEQSARETTARLADKVAGCEFCFEGKCLPLSIAIGFTVVEDGDSPEAVLDRADEAMYVQKDAA